MPYYVPVNDRAGQPVRGRLEDGTVLVQCLDEGGEVVWCEQVREAQALPLPRAQRLPRALGSILVLAGLAGLGSGLAFALLAPPVPRPGMPFLALAMLAGLGVGLTLGLGYHLVHTRLWARYIEEAGVHLSGNGVCIDFEHGDIPLLLVVRPYLFFAHRALRHIGRRARGSLAKARETRETR